MFETLWGYVVEAYHSLSAVYAANPIGYEILFGIPLVFVGILAFVDGLIWHNIPDYFEKRKAAKSK